MTGEREDGTETAAPAAPEAETPAEPTVTPQPTTPASRRKRTVAITVAVTAIVVIAVSAGLIWWLAGGPMPAPGPATAPDSAAASSQAKAVGDLLSAWVADDRAAIEKRVTADSVPWTEPPPPIPANVPRQLLAAVVKPRMQGDQWVVGDESVALVKLTGDGMTPTGTVTAEVVTPQGSRTVTVGVVLEGSDWKVATVDGLPAAQGLSRLLR